MKRHFVSALRLAALVCVSGFAAQSAEAAGIKFNNPFSMLSRAPYSAPAAAAQRPVAMAQEPSASSSDYAAPVPKNRPRNLMIAATETPVVAAAAAAPVEAAASLQAAAPPAKIAKIAEPVPVLPKPTSKQDALDARIMSTVVLGQAETVESKPVATANEKPPAKTASQDASSVMFSSKPSAAALIGQSGASVLTPPNMSGALAAFVNGSSKSVATKD